MWTKLDDKLHDHEKIRELLEEYGDSDDLEPLAALGLWTLAASWCGDQLSDGAIRESVLRRWADRDAPKLAQHLIDVGLFDPPEVDERGRVTHQLHDYTGPPGTGWNDSRAKVLFNREQNALRAEFARDKLLKAAIDDRDRDRCRYCGSLVHWADKRGPNGGTYDHVKPLADGGKNTLENVVVACRSCNQRKGKRTLRDARMRLLAPGALGAPADEPAAGASSVPRVGSGLGPSTCAARTPHAQGMEVTP